MTERRVAIIGGGWAGLSAAVTLADAGCRAIVFETARLLGGRARRVEFDEREVDNGLHILLGAYRQTLAVIDKVGASAGLLRLPLQLHIADRFDLACPRWPAPLHLIAGLLGARGLSWRDRVAAVTFMRRLQRMRYRTAPGQTVDMLLDQHRQPPALRRLLWEPLCVAALNTPSRIADAQVFLAVLREGLDGPTGSSDLLLPTTDLSKLFPEPAADYVAARGGTIRTGTPVRGLRPLADRFTVATATGHEDFAAVIVAVDAPRVGTVLGNIDALRPVVDAAARLDHGPIASVYLQYPPETTL
ncbi:MAG: FAD-dependent oxidoreductase, partial [Burkholderiales bacterium]|nr:FAD-dependent oxidoreductase [Burkholderiales bacterium]